MDIKLKRYASACIIELSGELDLYNAGRLKEVVAKLAARKITRWIIDLDRVTYIDSSGIGALLHTHAMTRRQEGQLRIANVGGTVKKVIELTKLFGFLPIVESIQEAIAQLSGAQQEASS